MNLHFLPSQRYQRASWTFGTVNRSHRSIPDLLRALSKYRIDRSNARLELRDEFWRGAVCARFDRLVPLSWSAGILTDDPSLDRSAQSSHHTVALASDVGEHMAPRPRRETTRLSDLSVTEVQERCQ
jgi:hypothetical protein